MELSSESRCSFSPRVYTFPLFLVYPSLECFFPAKFVFGEALGFGLSDEFWSWVLKGGVLLVNLKRVGGREVFFVTKKKNVFICSTTVFSCTGR